jgi:hypothetical protein
LSEVEASLALIRRELLRASACHTAATRSPTAQVELAQRQNENQRREMFTDPRLIIPAILAIVVFNGYVLWRLWRTRSTQRPAEAAIDRRETSELNPGLLAAARWLLAIFVGFFALLSWKLYQVVVGGHDDVPVWVLLLPMLVVGSLGWYLLRYLQKAPARSVSFDVDGLWRTQLGKDQGLVRWEDIAGIKEDSFWCVLSLFAKDGRLLLKVEYERDSFSRIRTEIMERMSFRPPILPAVLTQKLSARLGFACAALFFAVISKLVFTTPGLRFFGVALLCFAILFGFMVLRPLKIVIGHDQIKIGFRTYPYSVIRSVEALYWNIRGQMFARVKLILTTAKPVFISTNSLNTDSLTLQRTILWALANSHQPATP